MQLLKHLRHLRKASVRVPLGPLAGASTAVHFRRDGIAFVTEVEIPSKDKKVVRAKLRLRWIEAAILVGFFVAFGLIVGYRHEIASHWLLAQWAPNHLGKAAAVITVLAVAGGLCLTYWKRKQQFMYALAEITFGAFSAFQIALVLWPNGEVAKFVTLASAVYVVSRGVGNLNEALAKEIEKLTLKIADRAPALRRDAFREVLILEAKVRSRRRFGKDRALAAEVVKFWWSTFPDSGYDYRTFGAHRLFRALRGTELGAQVASDLMPHLQHERYRSQRHAARALGRLGDRSAVEPLLSLVEQRPSEGRDARSTAAWAVAQLGDPRAFDTLAKLLRNQSHIHSKSGVEDGDDTVGIESAMARMASTVRDSYSHLERLANDDCLDVRRAAVAALAYSGDSQCFRTLKELLRDKDVVNEALFGLGALRDERAFQPLMVRFKRRPTTDVIDALGRLGDTRAVVPIANLFQNRRAGFEERQAAARALGRLHDARAYDTLVPVVRPTREGERYLFHDDPAIVVASVEALGLLGDQRAVDELLHLTHFEDLGKTAARALGRLGDRRAVPRLLELLPVRAMSEHVAEALGRLGDVTAVKPLIEALRDETSQCRDAAAEALGRLGDDRAVPALVSLVKSEKRHWFLLRSATHSLWALGPGRERSVQLIPDEQHFEPLYSVHREALSYTSDLAEVTAALR